MRLVSLTGTDEVSHPDYGSATAGPDGVFDVGDLFGRFLLRTRSQWLTEADKLAADARAAMQELKDPRRAVEVLAQLRAHSAVQDARIAALEELVRQLGGDPDPQPEGEPEGDGQSEAQSEDAGQGQSDGQSEDEGDGGEQADVEDESAGELTATHPDGEPVPADDPTPQPQPEPARKAPAKKTTGKKAHKK